MSRSIFLGAAAIAALASTSLSAQSSITERISSAPDGVVRMEYASRSGTCGDGREIIGFRKSFFMENMQSFGTWNSPQCVPGPLRVAISVVGGRATGWKAYVGGTWAQSATRVTDLGQVSPVEAASYLFSAIPQLDGRTKKDRLLLPAVLADDPSTVSKLVALARDARRSGDLRRESVHWIGLVGDASVVPTLLSFVKSDRSAADVDDDGMGPGEEGLGKAAIAALSFIQDGGGVPALVDLAKGGAPGVRRSAVFWLGQTGDARAIAALHVIIENQRESDALRKRAIFSLSHGEAPPAEFAYLRRIYPRLGSNELKQAVFMGMEEDETGGTWLLDVAKSPSESIDLRKKALFWAGQRSATPTQALVDFYRSTSDSDLREHAIFVLSQRDDDAAMNELLRIAKDDKDRDMRKKALFWLAQKDDPRVAKLISDRVMH